MKSLTLSAILMLAFTTLSSNLSAQQKTILVDVAHGEIFYSDPADKISTQLVPTQRLDYMIGELTKNAAAHNATLAYLKGPVTPAALSKCNLLFIHVPSKKYTPDECAAIRQFVEKGGSLFVVMEEDYWATLDQVNINDIVKPFGIVFGAESHDKSSGAHSILGEVTKVKYSIPAAGIRLVDGGMPLAYSNASNEHPIGVYVKTKGGGKIVAMGEGMVSLYMTSWQGVNDYQCSGFMDEVIGWLLK